MMLKGCKSYIEWTFSSSLAPTEWSQSYKTVFYLASSIKDPLLDPSTLHIPNQHLVPPPTHLPGHIPFHQACTLNVRPTPLPIAKVDGYSDGACTISLNLPSNVA
eukprot:13797355-Ditylum_brightwellii.AAC.2